MTDDAFGWNRSSKPSKNPAAFGSWNLNKCGEGSDTLPKEFIRFAAPYLLDLDDYLV